MSLPITVAGIMSGTSLDGLDVAICRFEELHGRWTFEVLAATTFDYTDTWRKRLGEAATLNGRELALLHADFGHFTGQCIKDFCKSHKHRPDLVASHGHTVFHEPARGFTLQIGDGAAIASESGIDTVSDFRSTDLALGGQGAPLVPIGDQLLFGGHKFCLNLGGISNVSYDLDGKRIAFDIGPANMALNYLSGKAGKEYDKDGAMAMKGKLIPKLLDKLDALGYYQEKPPKSLGREWFEKEFQPLITDPGYTIPDLLHTTCHHIAQQIRNSLFSSPGTTLLTTGGGAFNPFLVELIEEQVSRHGIHVVVPDATVVQFKEAIIFAFLGMLREAGQINVLSTVTGASRDSISGGMYKG